MEGIQNCEKFNFKDLEDIKQYPVELIEELKKENIDSIILYLDSEQRNKKEVMLPVLYTIKNEFNTYIVYEYFNDELQKDMVDLAKEIAKEEPEVLKGSAICNSKQFVEVIKENPNVTKYMSEQLKQDTEVVVELANSEDRDVLNNLAQNVNFENLLQANPEVINNPDIMMAYIREDASVIGYVSEELKDNYEFIENACIGNLETITYVSEHTDDFGIKGLEATKNVLVSTATQTALDEIEVAQKALEQASEEQDILEEKVEESELVSDEKPEKKIMPKMPSKKKTAQRSMRNNARFLKKIQNGEIDPARAARLIKTFCKDIDPKYMEKIEQFIKINDATEKRKEQEQVIEEEAKIGLEDIEGATAGVGLEGVNITTSKIKSELGRETEEIEKQGEEYGE